LACNQLAQRDDKTTVEKSPLSAPSEGESIGLEPYPETPNFQGYNGSGNETVNCYQDSSFNCTTNKTQLALIEQLKRRCTEAGGEVKICNCSDFLCSKFFVAGRDDLTIDDTSDAPVGSRPNGTPAKCDPVGKPDTCESSESPDFYHKDCTDAGGTFTDCSCSSMLCSKPFNTVMYNSADYEIYPVVNFEVSLPKGYFLASADISVVLSKVEGAGPINRLVPEAYFHKPTESWIIKTKQFQFNDKFNFSLSGRRAEPYCDSVSSLFSSVITEPKAIRDLVFTTDIDPSYSHTYVEGKVAQSHVTLMTRLLFCRKVLESKSFL
jgi:hypothetical protein